MAVLSKSLPMRRISLSRLISNSRFSFSIDFFPTCLSSLAILAGREAFHAEEELAERGGVGEVETVGDLLDAEARRAQQEGDLHHEHLVNVVDDDVASFSINLNRKTIITN